MGLTNKRRAWKRSRGRELPPSHSAHVPQASTYSTPGLCSWQVPPTPGCPAPPLWGDPKDKHGDSPWRPGVHSWGPLLGPTPGLLEAGVTPSAIRCSISGFPGLPFQVFLTQLKEHRIVASLNWTGIGLCELFHRENSFLAAWSQRRGLCKTSGSPRKTVTLPDQMPKTGPTLG